MTNISHAGPDDPDSPRTPIRLLISVLNWNTSAATLECVHGLVAQTPPPHHSREILHGTMVWVLMMLEQWFKQREEQLE